MMMGLANAIGNQFLAGAGGDSPGSTMRQIMSNRNTHPTTFSTSQVNRFGTFKHKFIVPQGAIWSNIEMDFANFVANSVALTTDYPTLEVKKSILHNGVYYPATYSGNEKAIVAGGGAVKGSNIGLVIDAVAAAVEAEATLLLKWPLLFTGQVTDFTVGELVTGGTSGATGIVASQTDGGTSGSLVLTNETGIFVHGEALTGNLGGVAVTDLNTAQRLITSILSRWEFNEGLRGTNDSSIDWTVNSYVTYPVYTATVSGGNVTSVSSPANVTGTAAAGASNTITLAVSASSSDDAYNGRVLSITSGTGSGQSGTILDYVGSTKVATMAAAWVTPPDATSVYSISAKGSGWTVAPNMICSEVIAGRKWVKNIGYGNTSAGGISSGVVTNGTPPAGLAAWVNPTITFAGGSGFGNNTAIPACAAISGVPDRPVKSLLLVGDSIAALGSDSEGDARHNFNLFERGLDSRCPVANISTPGGKASYYAQYATTYAPLYALYTGLTTHALITLGTNDIADGGTKAALVSNVTSIADYLRTFDTEVSFSTLLPRTSGSLTPLASQTPVSGFASGGAADQYNADVISGTLVADWPIVNSRSIFQAPSDANKYRDDQGTITNDLIHPSEVGLVFAANDLTFRGYFGALE